MKNYGLMHFKTATVKNFTSYFDIRIRRYINPVLRPILRIATKGRIHIDRHPTLNKERPYIFAAVHGFSEDIIATLATIDRNAYVRFGTTTQLEHNPQVHAAWLNGFIYA